MSNFQTLLQCNQNVLQSESFGNNARKVRILDVSCDPRQNKQLRSFIDKRQLAVGYEISIIENFILHINKSVYITIDIYLLV